MMMTLISERLKVNLMYHSLPSVTLMALNTSCRRTINENLLVLLFPRPSLLRGFHIPLEPALFPLFLSLRNITSVFPRPNS